MLYSRAEGHLCLAQVRFYRGELDEAERLCAAALELVSGTESRDSLLYLGALYIEALRLCPRTARKVFLPKKSRSCPKVGAATLA
ncbi:MAG TPA: hypothetical protein VKA70_20690 [Blastocatellia bacterium]|nr:hypothetical protein [Blastocatellia bacterium]